VENQSEKTDPAAEPRVEEPRPSTNGVDPMPLTPEDQLDWQENQRRTRLNKSMVDVAMIALTLLAIGVLVVLIVLIRKAFH
jgi:hypothetical protein